MNLQMMQTRAIKGLPSTVLIALWSCVPQALPIKELVFWTDSNDDDVRKACNVLEHLGYIEADVRERGEKFFHISSSAQMLLPGFAQVLPAPVEQLPGTGKSDSGSVQVVNQAQKSGKTRVFDVPGTAKSDSGAEKTGSIMMIDDDESINLINESSSIMNPDLPSLEKLLEGLEILFEASLDKSELPAGTTQKILLAWTLKAYQDRKRLTNPIGMIRARLKSKTARSLPKDWDERFPADYLEAIGRRKAQAELVTVEVADEEEPAEAELPAAVDNPKITRAWECVLGQLQAEMPRASFEKFVSNTRPVSWDELSAALQVAASSEDAREWLENRLLSTVTRLLAGMLGAAVEVEFVVWRKE